MDDKKFTILVLVINIIVLFIYCNGLHKFYNQRLNTLEEQVVEIGTVACSNSYEYSTDVTGYSFSLEKGCELFYDE